MNIFTDNNATGNLSFLIPVFLIACLFTGVVWAGTGYGINKVLDIHNVNVGAGITSQQTADNIGLAKNLNKLLTLIAFLGIIIWTKNRLDIESTYVDASLLFSSIGFMFVMGFVTVMLLLMGGMMMDTTTTTLNGVSSVDIQNTSFGALSGTVDTTKDIAYAVCYLPIFIGASLFLLNSVRRTTGTTYDTESDYVMAGVD